MKKEIEVSLIIATYNWPRALELCLGSILKQTTLPSEVIIADDGSGEETREVIENFKKQCPASVIHLWQEDKGFRKTRILNKAIAKACANYIIQIDGDIILNRHFIKDHICMAEEGCFIRGTRANLNPNTTMSLLEQGKLSTIHKIRLTMKQLTNALRLPPMIAQFATRKELSGRKVKGCNMSFRKKDLIAINGYDNSLQGWGHEDEELSWRLVNAGLKKKIIKFSAIAYHLHHNQLSRDEEPHHREFMQAIKEQKRTRTDNGIEEI